MSEPSSVFLAMLRAERLPEPVAEHTFHPTRKWRFDLAWPAAMVAMEIDGGVWTRGRHNRPAGFLRDMEKINAAVVLGWRVVRTTPDKLRSSDTLEMLRILLASSPARRGYVSRHYATAPVRDALGRKHHDRK